MRVVLRFGAALVAAVGLVVPQAYAADEGVVLRQSAERLAAADRCDEAIEKARRARALAPSDAAAAALEGRCAIQLKRYDEAIAPLQTARRLDPTIPLISADLAMAHFHLEQLDEADAALTEAEKTERDHPKVLLYRGMIHMERAENVQAATSLERAARANDAIDPLASYYAARAWQRAQERQRARTALERASAQDPSSVWSKRATSALEDLDSADVGIGEWWATVTAGIEWDDNVVLRGEDVSLPNVATPQDISDQQDLRGFWGAEVGAELFRSANWAGGAILGYYGNAHVDTHAFDVQSPVASLWLDRRVDEQTFIRLQPFVGYTWTSTDPYVAVGGGTLSWHQTFSERAGSGRLYTSFAYRNYMYELHDPVTKARIFFNGNDISEERDRDGTDFRVGYDHALDVLEGTSARAGIYHGRYEAEGDEYTHVSYGGYVGASHNLIEKVVADVDVGYSYEPYRHDSTFPIPGLNTKDRIDQIWSVRGRLSRPLNETVTVAAYWNWIDQASNTEPFDYDRNIIGGEFTLSFGP